MKNLKALLALALAASAAAGCTTAYYGSAGSGFDDLYATHDRVAIANRQKAEAEARQAEAEARKAEWEAMMAEAKAEAAEKEYTSGQTGSAVSHVIVLEDDQPESFVADTYESAYARRLRGFTSLSYRMPSSYYNLRYSGTYTFATAYDPAFYNVMVSGDEVWVEPKYITSMFGSWGATNVTAALYSPWYFGWGVYDPWYYSWWGYPHYSWWDWNWNICYSWRWGYDFWWGWGGIYSPWYYPHWSGPYWGWGPHWGGHWGGPHWGGHWGGPHWGHSDAYRYRGGNYYGSRNNSTLGGRGNATGPSFVNRGSGYSTPYRSPSSGTVYGSRGSRGGESISFDNNATTGRVSGSVGRGTVTLRDQQTTNSNRNNTSLRNNNTSRERDNSLFRDNTSNSFNNNSSFNSNSNRGGGSYGSGFSGGGTRGGGGGGSRGGGGGGSRGR